MRTLGLSRRIRLAMLLAAGAHLALPATGSAQNQPVVFVHGLFSSGDVWGGTANYLAQLYQIDPRNPTLGWYNSFETQAGNLETALAGWSNAGAMAWSNGGLVERRYVQQFGAATRINRGFTVGTPHHGAQLAQAVRDGTATRYANYLFNSIADPFNFYYNWDPDFQQAMDFGPDVIIRDAFEIIGGVAYYLMPIINDVGVPIANDIPVGAEMTPSNTFITSLNSSANLSAEQTRLPTRVSSATGISPDNAFFTLFSNDPDDWGAIRSAAMFYALLLYDYYSTHPDYFLQANAYRWLEMYDALAFFDANWLALTGSILGIDQYGFVIPDQQDGLVPLSSATWPGATIQENRLWPSFSIPHRSQITHPAMLSVMQDVVNVKFGIPVRPPPVQASISGPDAIEEYQYGTWTAGTSGGVSPYTYQWTEDGSYAGNGSAFTDGGWSGGSSHTVGLVVTDATGHTSSASLGVYVTYSNGCLYPPCP